MLSLTLHQLNKSAPFLNVKTYSGYWIFRGWEDLLSKTCRWYGLWKKLLKELLCYVCEIPVSGVTWIVPRQSPRMLLVALRPFFTWTEDLAFCLCLLKWLHKCPDVTLQLYLHGKMPCLTVVVTLELDLHLADASSPTPFSCCSPFCSFTLKRRISCDRLAILNGMGWEGTKAKLLWHFSLLCAASCVPWKKQPKRYC